MAQVQKFFTSEILVLPKKANSLEFEEKIEEKVIFIKKILDDYLATKADFALSKNLTFFNLEYANFPIEEVRKMQVEAEYSSSFSGKDRRVFVLLNFDSATAPAQNAALKIIEESPKDTLILLLVSNKERILETIASRCLVVSLETEEKSPQSTVEKIDFVWPKNYSQAIDLALENKDRAKATHFIEELLRDKSLTFKKKQLLLQSYQDLRRNQNVQLVLENCFFQIINFQLEKVAH